MDERRQRITSGYTIVIHEVWNTAVKIWVGALSPSRAKPHNWRLVVWDTTRRGFGQESDKGIKVESIEHLAVDGDVWQRPFDKLKKRFYKIETITGLDAGKDYTVEFEVRRENQWVLLETAFFTTLPERLPRPGRKPFTVGIASCFYTKHDGGRMGRAYEALFKHKDYKPDIKFLTGDQVYADIGLGVFPLSTEDCQDRIADHYEESWTLMRSMLRRGGTWMVPDDHEYWNNYPFLKGFNPYLVTLDWNKGFRRRWEAAAKTGVQVVQQVQTLRKFSVGKDLSFCVADLRTERTKEGFISGKYFQQMVEWVKGLKSPGVLVVPQPLLVDHGDDKDATLADWKQYNELLVAMKKGKHDVVVLTGDVHYGRVAKVELGTSGNNLVEVITSPMSNLSELDGLFAKTPELPKKTFPFIDIPEIEKQKIEYLGKVSTEQKWWDLRFPVRRTTEHFMTVEFHKVGRQVQMQVRAWEARRTDRKTNLPKPVRGFKVKPVLLK